jgi:hypothetical protein
VVEAAAQLLSLVLVLVELAGLVGEVLVLVLMELELLELRIQAAGLVVLLV